MKITGIILTLLTLSGIASHAQTPYPDHRQITVNQTFFNQTLNLTQLMGLYSANGEQLQSVEVTVYPSPYANLALLADYNVLAIDSSLGNYNSLIPNQVIIMGSNVQNLNLQINGQLYVQTIGVTFRGYGPYPPPPPPPPPGTITLPLRLDQDMYGSFINLTAPLALSRYRGYRVVQITVSAHSLSANSELVAGFDGVQDGVVLPQYTDRTLQIFPRGLHVIDQNFQSLYLSSYGNNHVNYVQVVLAR